MGDFTAYVMYYDDHKAALLTDCLIPLARSFGSFVDAEVVFLERHWRFGPHVALSVLGGKASAQATFARNAQPVVEEYLRRVPSTARLDPASYLRRSAELATAELVRPPYGPIRPDNTVVLGAYQARVDLYGASGATAKARYLGTALDPVAALLTETRESHPARLAYVLRLLAHVATRYGDAVAGTLSYRSHVEDFLHRDDPQGAIRRAFDAKYARIRDEVVGTVRDMFDVAPGGGYRGADPVLAQWSGLFDGTWRHLEQLAALHEIDEEPAARYYDVARRVSDDATQRWDYARRRTFGAFHRSLRSLNFLSARQNVPAFTAYRWLVNLFYLTIPLLDVSPIERYFVTYAVAEAADEIAGVPWEERLRALGASRTGK